MSEAELWSTAPGDATAETIVEETAWEGAAAGPESARAMLERWRAHGAWVIGLYEGAELIGLFDVGRFTREDVYRGRLPDAAGLLDEPAPRHACWQHLTHWFAIRPAARGRVPGPVFQALSDAFLRHLWDRGIRRMVTVHLLHTAEGRAHAERVERFGWRTVRRTGLVDLKAKVLRRRP